MSNYHRQASRKSARAPGKSRQYINYLARSLALFGLITSGSPLWLMPVFAAPTPAVTNNSPTTIDNQATGTFADLDDTSTGTQNVVSNTVTVTVAEVAGISIVSNNTPTALVGGVANFDFKIKNIGNDPTKFFLPSTLLASKIGGGTQSGVLQVVGYVPAGTTTVTPVTAIDVATAGDTNSLTDVTLGGNTTLGSIPADAAIIVRVKVTVTALAGSPVSVFLGDTPTLTVGDSNISYIAGTNDVYTVDNPNSPVVGEAAGAPINGVREASATQSVNAVASGLDFGDAPDTYGTLLASNGARHSISSLHLGAGISVETDGKPNATATGDDSDDGVTFSSNLGSSYGSLVQTGVSNQITVISSEAGFLNAWIDYNGNGTFDSGEQVFTNQAVVAGINTLTFTPASNIPALTTFARFRLSPNSITTPSPIGLITGGEVEDYQVYVGAPISTVCSKSAADGSYATSGLNKNSIWWLNWECYNETIATLSLTGQPFSFNLPDGSSMTVDVKKTGPKPARTTTLPTSPFSTFGRNNQYTGIPGSPVFYNATNPGSGIQDWTETLNNIIVRDKNGNVRNYTFVSADGENTNQVGDPFGNIGLEQLKFGTNGTGWSQVELLSTPTGAPTNILSGVGTANATWAANGNNNGSVIISTNNPTQVSLAAAMGGAPSNYYTSAQGGLFGIGMPKVTLIKNIVGRVSPTDQFTTEIDYTSPTVALQTVTSAGAATTSTTGAISVLPGNLLNLKETMAAGSSSALTAYNSSMTCTNANPTATVLPLAKPGTIFEITPQVGDDITCTLTNTVPGNPNVLLVKRITKINNQDFTTYEQEDANPYDDNELEPTLAPKLPAYPTADTTYWPDTTGKTSSDFLVGKVNGGNIKPNDSIEYTIYFLSAGTSTANNVLFCDRVPNNVTFLPTAFNSLPADSTGLGTADRGIAAKLGTGILKAYTNIADGDFAQYFPPNVEPSTVYPKIKCGGTNVNGAVVVNLGNVNNATAPRTPPESYGFVRFQGIVK